MHLRESPLMDDVEYAYANSPFIESRWKEAGIQPGDIGSPDRFKKLVPCFDKDDIQEFRDKYYDSTAGLARLDNHDINKVVSTSDATGGPTPAPIRSRQKYEYTKTTTFI